MKLTEGLQVFSERLLAATDVEDIWDMAVASGLQALAAEHAVWIWDAPQLQITAQTIGEPVAEAQWRAWIAQSDVQDSAGIALCLTESPPLHAILVPIEAHAWRGWLAFARPTAFAPDALETAQALVAVTRLAAIGQMRYQTAEQTRARQTQKYQAWQEVSRKVSQSLDLDTTLYLVLDALANLVPYDAGEITLLDAERNVLVSRVQKVPDDMTLETDFARVEYRMDEGLSGWLARHRQPMLIDDANSLDGSVLKHTELKTWLRAFLGVPLQARGNLVGTLEIGAVAPHHFTQHDLELTELLGSQAAIAIENARLYQAAQEHVDLLEAMMEHKEQQTEHLRSLVAVSAAVGASLDLEMVLEQIVQSVSSMLECQRTVIFVLDAEGHTLDMVAAQGISERYHQLSQGVAVAQGGRAHAVAANKIVVVDNVQDDPLMAEVAPFAGDEGFQAFVDLPLRRGDMPIGLLSVQFTEPHTFTDDELSILQIIGEQAAIAIENARLYTDTDVELHRRLDALEALHRVTREITSTVDLDYILNVVLDEAMEFSEARAGAMATFDADVVNLRVFKGFNEEEQHQLYAMVEDASEQALFVRLRETQDTLLLENGALSLNAQTVLVVPVFYEERIAAAIWLQSERPRAFGAAAVEFVEGLAVQTSIAVGNAQRYQEQLKRGELMHKRAEQMSLLLEVSRTMRSDRPLEEMLLDVAYAVQEGTGFEIVLISVLEGNHLRRVAGAGIPLAELERMKRVRQPWSRINSLFQDRFRMGHCYYIPAEYDHLTGGLDKFVPQGNDVGREPGQWHKLDSFVIPLYGSHGDVLGIMSVDVPRDGRVPTPNTAEVLEIFAAQVALAIENSQLVEDLRRQVTTLRLFNELNRSITTKLDLPMVLNTVVQSVTNLLGYDYATIYLQDKTGQHLVPMASSGYALELLQETTFKRGEGAVGVVMQTGMPLVSEDVAQDPRFEPGPVEIGASIMVPLTVEDRSVGVLVGDRKEPGDFSPTDVATLTALGDQVSVAVDNARLFAEVKGFSEELERRVEERTQELAAALENLRVQRDRSEVLYHIASELVANLDVDRILSQALSLLQKAVKASKSAVLLSDAESGQMHYRAAIGHTTPIPQEGREAPFRRDTGLVGWVLERRQAIIIPDVRADDRWENGIDPTIRSVLAAPVLGSSGADGDAWGIILMQSPLVGIFGDQELRLVEAAAVQLGNALNNAELYRLLAEQAERLGAMLRAQQIEAAKNEAILEGIADGVMVADANGRIMLFNAAAERILSISRAHVLGRFQDDILGLYGNAAQEWLERIEAWMQAPQSYGAEEFLAHRLEMEREIVSVHISPVIAPNHEFLGVVSVFRDITAEVEADRAKSEFVSTVSHELRTPMTSIKGYVDLLLMGAAGPMEEAQQNFLKTVKVNADRLTTLVNDLLDISRIETGRVELIRKPLSTADAIGQVVELLKPKIEEKDQRLYTVLPDDLPKIYGDEARVTQILTNIIGNAYKYTPNGGEIGLYAYARQGKMYIAVADTGIGIAEENQQKIFDRFYRVEDDPAVYEVSGTGLGLAITLSLIHMHGGDISLESELGEGSIFTFSIPLAEGEPTVDVGEPPPSFKQASTRASILIVEDDAEVAGLLKATLEEQLDLDVRIAHSGQHALKLAKEQPPDIISLDIRLPDLDGREVLQHLKDTPETCDIPVIIVSVVPEREEGLLLGAVDYLVKPLEQDSFLNAVERILHQRGTVVLADEDQALLKTMRSALQARGLSVHTTTRGERALCLARELHPELLLLDLALSDVDGYQVLEKLKRNPHTADIPVILTTSRQHSKQRDDATDPEALGALRFMTKPFSVEEFAEEITGLITGNGAHKE